MFAETSLPNHRSLTLAARLLFTSLFFLSGVTHFSNVPYYVSLMPEAVPFPVELTLISGVVELLGAAMILFSWRPRLGAWLLIAFLIPVTLVVHGYELITQADPALWGHQQAHFLKCFALIGAALLITQIGVTHRPANARGHDRASLFHSQHRSTGVFACEQSVLHVRHLFLRRCRHPPRLDPGRRTVCFLGGFSLVRILRPISVRKRTRDACGDAHLSGDPSAPCSGFPRFIVPDGIDLGWLIGVQAFRVVGGLYLLEHFRGNIGTVFAYWAGIGDVLTGLLACYLLLQYWRTGSMSQRLAFWTIIFGLADFAWAYAIGVTSFETPLQVFASGELHATNLFPIALIPFLLAPIAMG